MKHSYFRIQVLVFTISFFCCAIVFAQPAQGNVVVVNNAELSLSGDGSVSEFDSLTVEYNKWCMDKNEFVISYKVVRHWWGNNNRNFVTIVEVKSREDVLKFSARSVELFEEHWNSPESRKAFNDVYNNYFTGIHSDEIYSEVVSNK
jgi:hypothetical protein